MSSRIDFEPKTLGFLCNWCCYAGADLCGVSRLQYPPYMKMIRVMCTGRVDLTFILRAFLNGNDGVFIGGCWPGECHYVTEGNYHAVSVQHIAGKLLELAGVDPRRLRLEWVSASQGVRFAQVMNSFYKDIQKLGPIGKGEGIEREELRRGLKALLKLVPYIRLVERERLRIHAKSEQEIEAAFAGDQFKRIFKDLIADKYEICRIMDLLREKACSKSEISSILGLQMSDVSRHLGNCARQGMALHDEKRTFIAVTCEH